MARAGMPMSLPEGEPAAGAWNAVSVREVLGRLLAAAVPPAGPVVVAVDGRGASGKSSLADRLVAQFDAYTVLGEVPVNGRLTLGENIADLGGLALAQRAHARVAAAYGG